MVIEIEIGDPCCKVYRDGVLIDECLDYGELLGYLEDLLYSGASKIVVHGISAPMQNPIKCVNIDRIPRTSNELEQILRKLAPTLSDNIKNEDEFDKYCWVASHEYAVCYVNKNEMEFYVRGMAICVNKYSGSD